LDTEKKPGYIPVMTDSRNPKPLVVAILLALVLTAWCLASNSVESGSASTESVASVETN